MTMSHKTCPQCGQPAVLTMPQCQRCGFVYGPGTSAPSSSLPTPLSRERPRTQQAALQPRSILGPLLLFVALGLGVVVLGVGVRMARHAALRRTVSAARGLSGGSALNGAPADASAPPSKFSFFVESDSQQEMPKLTFRNMAIGTLTLTLRDRYGHMYRASSSQEEEATLQVPAGDYSVSIDNDSPLIRPNWGDATFRKFKSYHANFVVGHSNARIHLGE